MDLLGSILSTMDKPPEADEKQKELIRSTSIYILWSHSQVRLCKLIQLTVFIQIEQKEHIEKVQEYERREIMKFRKFCEERINRFTKDDNRKSLQFQPLSRIYRTVVYVGMHWLPMTL